MPAKSQPLSRTVRQLRAYLDFLHQYNSLPQWKLDRFNDPKFVRAFAKTILHGKKAQLARHEFSVVKLRSLQGRTSSAVLGVDRRLKKPKPALRAFVGHRFIDPVTRNLRHNLLLVLKQYRVDPWYSDSDMPNGPVFNAILTRIRDSAFCIFDDRETETRPNVFIELGAALALNRPYFHLSYTRKRTIKAGRREEEIAIPSDLQGLLRLDYADYEDLFLQFAMKLPAFLQDRRLASMKTHGAMISSARG